MSRPPPGLRRTAPAVLASRIAAPLHAAHQRRLGAHRDGSAPLPPCVDLSLRPAFDQGQTSSCTAHALAKAAQILGAGMISEHVLYSLTGAREGDMSDDGRQLVDCLAVAASPGLAPYAGPVEGRASDVTAANATTPATPAEVAACVPFASAGAGNSIDPAASDLAEQVTACLAAGGVIYLGAQVGAQFQGLTGDEVAIPDPANDPEGGGHALLIVGYRTAPEGGPVEVRVENSWGESWDSAGECWATLAWVAACWELHPLLPVAA